MISINLDDDTAARARQLAIARHCTVEELLKQLVAASEPSPPARPESGAHPALPQGGEKTKSAS